MNEDEEELALILPKKKKKKKVKVEEEIHTDESLYTYMFLLKRLYEQARLNNPVMGVHSEPQKLKIPPPILIKVGRKTIWSNFTIITYKMNRKIEHFMSYFLSERGVTGTLQNKGLAIKPHVTQDQVISIMKKYMNDYILCKECKSTDTFLIKDSITRLTFVECTRCNSKRYVSMKK